jgi:hypothetical protein
MHTFYVNVLFNYIVFDMFSNIQVFIFRKTCTCSFMVFLSCIHFVGCYRFTFIYIYVYSSSNSPSSLLRLLMII